MSAYIEWLAAAETSVQVFTPGEDWVGAGEHRLPVLTLAQDDVIAIEGTPAELRALAARITAVATAASARLDPRRRGRVIPWPPSGRRAARRAVSVAGGPCALSTSSPASSAPADPRWFGSSASTTPVWTRCAGRPATAAT